MLETFTCSMLTEMVNMQYASVTKVFYPISRACRRSVEPIISNTSVESVQMFAVLMYILCQGRHRGGSSLVLSLEESSLGCAKFGA